MRLRLAHATSIITLQDIGRSIHTACVSNVRGGKEHSPCSIIPPVRKCTCYINWNGFKIESLLKY